MRRTQIYIDEVMDQALRQRAAAEGCSAAALVREAVGAYLSGGAETGTAEDPVLAMIGVFTGLPPDAADEHDRYLYGHRPDVTVTGTGGTDRFR